MLHTIYKVPLSHMQLQIYCALTFKQNAKDRNNCILIEYILE